MTNETFNNSVLDRIHKEKVQPHGRWYFLSGQWFLGIIISLATIVGSVAITTTLFILTDHDWFVVDHLEEGLAVHIVKTIPYIWLVITAIAILTITYNIKKFGRGYRYAPWRIIALSLITSLVIGSALFFAGVGNYLDHYFDKTFPSYNALVTTNRDIWIYPEDGLLSGHIQTIQNNTFTIIDGDDQPWVITITPTTNVQHGSLIIGQKVKIIGDMIDGNHFTSTTVLPWSK